MRAAVLRAPRPASGDPLEVLDVPEPGVGADDVLIDVEACAVCRTDLQICEGDLEAKRLPIIPGHQVVGTVSARGKHVDDVKVGDRVGVAWIAFACGSCRFCVDGRENLCDRLGFTGWSCDGGFAERMAARADFVHRLPDGVAGTEAAPLLCGGAIGLRALRVAMVEPGSRVGLYGFGASATIALQVAGNWGCDVYVCTRSEIERRRARELGAVWAGGYDDVLPERLDAAVTFAPVGSVVVEALRALDKGGIVAINAIHLDRIPAFDYRDLWWERQIRSVANVTRVDVAELVSLAASIPITTQTETFALEDANEALRRVSQGSISGAAVLVP